MVLDIKVFRIYQGGSSNSVKISQKRRFNNINNIYKIILVDEKWREKMRLIDLLRKNKRIVAKYIGKFYKMYGKDEITIEQINLLESWKKKSKNYSYKINQEEKLRKKIGETRNKLLRKVGNLVELKIPISQNENYNRKESLWGTPRQNNGNLKNHHEILWMIGGYEPNRGVKVASHRAYFLTGPAVQLNNAVQQYSLDFLRKKNFVDIYPPFFMKQNVMSKTAQLEEFDEALYHVLSGDDNNKYLIATSEQPISAMHINEWIQDNQLPIYYSGISTCFRKESGKSGKDCWGIFRVHQFEKIEQFVFTKPEISWNIMDEILEVAKSFYESLNIPYEVVTIVTGELNNTAAKKYDLEGWFPTLGLYRELVSCSNCTDYQSRSMNTRFGQISTLGEKRYVHMLNSTLSATSRTICCILENYQDRDGIHIPRALQPYMDKINFIPYVRFLPENKRI